jgi:cytochrome oxidase Cu insertion factor (SCO1/SenC/PrrC family)
LEKTFAGRSKVAIAFLLIFGPAFLLVLIGTRGCEHKFKELDDYGVVKSTPFKIDGKDVSFADFKGEVLVITTLQKTCPEDCAISFWHVDQMIYQHIRKNKRKKLKQVKIISFVTDGKGNPLPEDEMQVVKDALKDNVESYDPSIWMIATGDAKSVYSFKHNGQNLVQKGDKYYGGEGFQELILLLDKEGHLRMVLPGNEEGLVRRMKEHIALLQKQYDKKNKTK